MVVQCRPSENGDTLPLLGRSQPRSDDMDRATMEQKRPASPARCLTDRPTWAGAWWKGPTRRRPAKAPGRPPEKVAKCRYFLQLFRLRGSYRSYF